MIANAGTAEFAQCSPILGVAVGVGKRFQNDWELTGSAGIAFSLVTDDQKVHENEVFIDVEGHKYLGRAFVGTGLSPWDITHCDTFTPAWLVLFGVSSGMNRLRGRSSSAKRGCCWITPTTSATTISSGRESG